MERCLYRALLWLLMIGVILPHASLRAQGAVLVASEDNFVRDGASANTVSGTPPGRGRALEVAARGTNANRKSYLQFDVAGQLESGQRFDEVVFRVTASMVPGEFLIGPASGLLTLNVYGLTTADSWAESTLTWNNAPQNVIGSATELLPQGSTLLGSFTIDTNVLSAGQSFSITGTSLTDYLNWSAGLKGDFYGTGSTSYSTPTLVITAAPGTPASAAGVRFNSREYELASYRPVLEFSVVPEPSASAALLGVGFLFVAARVFRARQGRQAVK